MSGDTSRCYTNRPSIRADWSLETDESRRSWEKFRNFPNNSAISSSYACGPFRLDAQGETLFRARFRAGEPVALSHRVVALLRIFIDRAGGPVSKDAPIKAAWPGLAVKDSNLTVKICSASFSRGIRRKKLDCDADP